MSLILDFVARSQQRIAEYGMDLAHQLRYNEPHWQTVKNIRELDAFNNFLLHEIQSLPALEVEKLQGIIADRHDLYNIPATDFLGYQTNALNVGEQFKGDDGEDGRDGRDGITPIIKVGNVTEGDTASVTQRGTTTEIFLDFVLPRGDDGDTIDFEIGEVTQGVFPSVSIDKSNPLLYKFNFQLAKGADGEDGAKGDSAYLYTAYANLPTGEGFSLTDTGQPYMALLPATTPISTPKVADFTGRWFRRIPNFAIGTVTTGDTAAVELVYDDGSDTWKFNFTLPKGSNDNSTTDIHNDLQGLQGGQAEPTKQYYHLTKEEYDQLKFLIYIPPTLTLDPLGVDITEVGSDYINSSLSVRVDVTQLENVKDGLIYFRRRQNGLLQEAVSEAVQLTKTELFNLSGTNKLSRTTPGAEVILEASIVDKKHLNTITKKTFVDFKYRVFWLAHPASEDLLTATTERIQQILDNIKASPVAGMQDSFLTSSPWNSTDVSLNPTTASLHYFYVIYPNAFGTAIITNQVAGYGNAMLTTSETEMYTNGTALSTYKITKAHNDAFAGPLSLMFKIQ